MLSTAAKNFLQRRGWASIVIQWRHNKRAKKFNQVAMNFPLNVNCQILIFRDLKTMIESRSGRYIAVFMLLSTTRNNEVQRVQFESSFKVDENCWEMAFCIQENCSWCFYWVIFEVNNFIYERSNQGFFYKMQNSWHTQQYFFFLSKYVEKIDEYVMTFVKYTVIPRN